MSTIRLQHGPTAAPLLHQLVTHPAFIAAVQDDREAGKRRSADDLLALIEPAGVCKVTTVRQARLDLERKLNSGEVGPVPSIGPDGYAAELSVAPVPKESLERDEKKDSLYFHCRSRTVRTLEELIAHAEIDTELWEVERVVANKWDMGYKDGDGEPGAHPLYQIKAWFKKRVGVAGTREALRLLIEDAKVAAKDDLATIRVKMKRPAPRRELVSPYMTEISPFDVHLSKFCWPSETGGDPYDLDIASRLFLTAIEALLERTSSFPPSHFLFPLGNDFFHVDNPLNQTTAGTPQDMDTRWQKMFRLGRQIAVKAIDMMAQVAPVDVLIVPGNHDYLLSYVTGDALECWYHDAPHVTIDNAPTLRKYRQFQKNMLLFTHGDKEPLKNLPLIMATEKKEMWGQTLHREAHTGHRHKHSELVSVPVDSFNGARVCVLPSLSAHDAWHTSRGYLGQRAAEAFVFHKDEGRIANVTYNVPPDFD